MGICNDRSNDTKQLRALSRARARKRIDGQASRKEFWCWITLEITLWKLAPEVVGGTLEKVEGSRKQMVGCLHLLGSRETSKPVRKKKVLW